MERNFTDLREYRTQVKPDIDVARAGSMMRSNTETPMKLAYTTVNKVRTIYDRALPIIVKQSLPSLQDKPEYTSFNDTVIDEKLKELET